MSIKELHASLDCKLFYKGWKAVQQISAHMKAHSTKQATCKVVIEVPGQAKKFTFVPAKHLQKLENFLEKYGESESISWEELAKDRIAKYKKSGLALRGATQGELMNFLNHRSPAMTRRYAHFSQQHIAKLMELTRTKVSLPGSYRRLDGNFEWIIEENKLVNHRVFLPDP